MKKIRSYGSGNDGVQRRMRSPFAHEEIVHTENHLMQCGAWQDSEFPTTSASSDEHREQFSDGEPMASSTIDFPASRHELLRGKQLNGEAITKSAINDKRNNNVRIVPSKRKVKFELEMTERENKRLYEAERVLQLKNTFLSMISHEIRTPLNIIAGYTALLAEQYQDRIPKADHFYFEAIEDASNRLIDTVYALINALMLESGTYVQTKRNVM